MARREHERQCTDCPCTINNSGRGKTHRICPNCQQSCLGKRQSREWEEQQQRRQLASLPIDRFEPQSVTFSQGPIGRPIDDPRNQPKFNAGRQDGTLANFLSPVRVAVLDIETTGLNAGFGVILCAVVKAYSPDEKRVFRADAYEPWKRGQRADDKALLQDILAYLEDVDIIIAHNGLKFDLPFLRTRAVIHGLPPVTFQKIIDPVQLARQHFRFSGNSLDSIGKVLSTHAQKTPLSPITWAKASLNGDPEAMEEIVTHCEWDVDVLEEVCWKLRGYIRTINNAGSFRQ